MEFSRVGGRARGQGGFTLIELLMVTSIIAILVGVAVFAVGRTRENATKNACHSERLVFETASNATSLDPSNDIRSYLQTDQGLYFEVSGLQSFARTATSPLDVNCE